MKLKSILLLLLGFGITCFGQENLSYQKPSPEILAPFGKLKGEAQVEIPDPGS